jgi:phage host-nuclease inhibitor protein Gam
MAKKLVQVTTLSTLEEVADKLAELRIVRSKLTKISGELDIKKTQLQQKYSPEITSLQEQQLLLETDLRLWAEEHKGDLDKKRSWDFPHGTIGFRESTKLSTIKRVIWKDVLERVKNFGGKYIKYVRTKEEINKDDLKTDILSKNITLDEAAKIGVCLETVDNVSIDTFQEEAQISSITSIAG